ncbi:hypothetical protein OX283_009850 [Flavobacterium sp. SUN052]|uniref:hypothetical protein n=1 Tax=Flavobacterium sp. SUN052 TaxID=3002441 RepID=UPI00237E3522|nr:hypothetical protein [Flavobacterium sp. SUN052]MEC4004959.1 hypothetical protein [Flavobacterium sp. SUN052]
MYKKITLIVLIFTVFISCKLKDDASDEVANKKIQPKDSTIVGADQDENGCLASAGYTWSKLNKECVRAFTGIQLNPAANVATEDVTLCAYVLFNSNADKAEVFLPDEKSFILTRSAEGKPWVFNEYQLIPKNGYILTKDGTTIYSGDGEIGNKVTGSDNPEGQE